MRRSLPLALGLALLLPAAASARDATITSYDGTEIVVHLLPTDREGKNPTVLSGHGWGGSGSTDAESSSNPAGTVGNGPLRKAGYNVVTWDARGFGNSGGTVTVDSPDNEARDVQAIIDWLAEQPEALLDGPGDPRVGMVGSSYGGGIQLVTAGLPNEKRIDVLVPDIAWHSLTTSLYQDATLKSGWGSLLVGAGLPASKGRLDEHITGAFTEGTATGSISQENFDWFASRGPGDLVKNIRIPTLLTQGTVDTLFPLDEAIVNYEILHRNGVPVKMMWHCGGHGTCTTPGGNGDSPLEARVLAWLKRHLDGDTSVDTGPAFEWVADDGQWRMAPGYPLAPAGALTGEGSGSLVLTPSPGSGTPLAAAPDPSGFELDIPAPAQPTQVVGVPELEVTYTANGASLSPRVFAQIVDKANNVVLGNQVTPVPLELDGAEHTVKIPLEAVAASATPQSQYALQLVSASSVYIGQSRTTASVDLSGVKVSLPLVDATRVAPATGSTAKVAVRLKRHKKDRLKLRMRVRRGPVTKVRIKVRDGKKVIATGRASKAKRKRVVRLRTRRSASPGRYKVVVRWKDSAGNRGILRDRVRVR